MRSKELAHTDEVTTFLVAGKELLSDVTCDQFDQISKSVDQPAEAIGQPLVALPSGFVQIMDSDDCLPGFVVGWRLARYRRWIGVMGSGAWRLELWCSMSASAW